MTYLKTIFQTYLYSTLFFAVLEAKKTTWVPALLGRARARKLSANVIVIIAKVLLLAPWFCLIIWLDDHVIHIPLVFPRTRNELMEHQLVLFQWLQRSAKWRISKSSTVTTSQATTFLSSNNSIKLVSIQDHNVLEHEPDKNVDTMLVDVLCDDGHEQRVLQLFVKFSCGRNFPMALQGIRCATEWGLQRELDFYKSIGRLQHILPCPTSVALGGSFAANRLCLAMDYVHGVVTPDYKGANDHQATSVLTTVSNMHGAFWYMNGEMSASSEQVAGNALAAAVGMESNTAVVNQSRWIANEIVSFLDKMNARKGLEYFSFIRPLLDKKDEPNEFILLWDKVEQWFDASDVITTVVHGDCRLGNMLFVPNKNKNDATTSGNILFTDFEAVNVAPYLWDVVYFTVLCQTPEKRRERHDTLINEYLVSLRTSVALSKAHRKLHGGVPLKDNMMPPHKISAEVNQLYDMLSLVLFFYSYTVERSGMWAGNGNSMEDLKFWTERLDARIQELDMTEMAKLLNVNIEWLAKVKNLEWGENKGSMSKKQR